MLTQVRLLLSTSFSASPLPLTFRDLFVSQTAPSHSGSLCPSSFFFLLLFFSCFSPLLVVFSSSFDLCSLSVSSSILFRSLLVSFYRGSPSHCFHLSQDSYVSAFRYHGLVSLSLTPAYLPRKTGRREKKRKRKNVDETEVASRK